MVTVLPAIYSTSRINKASVTPKPEMTRMTRVIHPLESSALRFEGFSTKQKARWAALIGLLATVFSGGALYTSVNSPLSQRSDQVSTIQTSLNRQLYQAQNATNITYHQDIHRKTVEQYCNSLLKIATVVASQPKQDPSKLMASLKWIDGLSAEEWAFCEGLVKDVQVNGFVEWDDNVNLIYTGKFISVIDGEDKYTYHTDDPQYTLENMFDRFADKVLYAHALKKYESHDTAKALVDEIKSNTHQFFRDQTDLANQQALLATALIASILTLVVGAGYWVASPW